MKRSVIIFAMFFAAMPIASQAQETIHLDPFDIPIQDSISIPKFNTFINRTPIEKTDVAREVTQNSDENTKKLHQETEFSVEFSSAAAAGKSKIEISSSTGGKAEINLQNSRGVVVKEIFKGTLSPGISTFTFDTSNLPQGSYYIVTELDGRQYADKLFVAK